MEWYIKALRHYADFSGRAHRKEFWLFMLVNMFFLLYGIISTIGSLSTIGIRWANFSSSIIIFFFTATILPSMAVAVRRLHDIGGSGWLLPVFLIAEGLAVNHYFPGMVGDPVIIGGAVVVLIGGIALLCIKGQGGENRYGPDPKMSPEVFGEQARWQSAGFTLSVASAIQLYIPFSRNPGPLLLYDNFTICLPLACLVIAGILLAIGKPTFRVNGKNRIANILLFAAFSMLIVFVAVYMWGYIVKGLSQARYFLRVEGIQAFEYWHFRPAISYVLKYILLPLAGLFTYLLLALLYASNLFFPNSNHYAKKIAGLSKLFSIIFLGCMVVSKLYEPEFVVVNGAYSRILLPIACILLSSAFLSRKAQVAANS